MKQALLIICCMLAVGGGTAAASVESSSKKPKPAWTEAKAERSVLQGATVRLAAEDRAALEAEFRPLAALYQLLVMDTPLGVENQDVAVYSHLAYTYSRLLDKVQRGLAIEAVDCSGSGVAATGRRFGTFRCSVTSESLELPPAQLAEDGEPPVDAQPRNVGPIEAELDIRVTGTSTFAYRKV